MTRSCEAPREALGTDDALLLFGTDEPVPPAVALQAGPLALTYRAGALGPVRLGDVEIWHGVSFTFRDPDWGTPEPVVTRETIETGPESFRIRVSGHVPTVPPIDVSLDIEGRSDGSIRVAAEAVPRGDVLANRLGLCVLHPSGLGGRPVVVGHDDGRESASTWPVLVPPWPPFTLVRSVRHEAAEGVWAHCDLSGDVFELEDQRNNADPSFKTYSRSNMMPRPYRLPAGLPVRQGVTLRLDRIPAAPWIRTSPGTSPVTLHVTQATRPSPPVGIAITPADAVAPGPRLEALRRLRPAQLHLTLWPDAPAVDWAGVALLLDAAGASLRIDLVTEGAAADPLRAMADALAGAGLRPESVAVFPGATPEAARARALFPGVRIGGGTPHYFAQANRLDSLGPVDFVSFTSSPLVHGAADEAVMLSRRSLPSLVATLAARHPGTAIRIGPSAIGVRRSPLGRQPDTDGTRRLALASRDPRSRALFGAAWALGYVAAAGEAGVERLTLASLTGDGGLADEAIRPLPAFAVLERLADRPATARGLDVSRPTQIAALALDRPAGTEILLANLTGDPVPVMAEGWRPDSAAMLDARSAADVAARPDGWDATRRALPDGPVTLPPYAVASLIGPGPFPPPGQAPR